MNLQDYAKLLRSRWITVVVTTALMLVAAGVYTLLATPMYQATTRLFVSTTAGASLSDAYQGNRFSQERVISYAELLTGETLARRTIDKLGLDIRPSELQENIVANAKQDTVLISVHVSDPSPVRARDIANTLSDEFVTLVGELETPADGSKPDSRVVVEQRASIPEQPVAPNKTRNMGIGLLVGLALGIALAVLRDMLDNTVKDRELVETVVGASLVGTVPLDKDRRKQAAIHFENDNSAIAESFRKLRTNLQFLAVDNPPRVIVLTSSMPSEGKSTTAINIALALAEADHNVVLVDGDLRRPSLHKYLDMVGTVGFSTVLSGGVSLTDALQKTRFPGLTVLTSGSIPPNPSEILGSQAARNVLSTLRSEFDYVIVDTTPLLAVTDAAILAASSDGVILVARYGHTKREQLTQAVGSLKDVDATILGTVFSMTPTRGGSAYGYSYRYYGEGVAPKINSDTTALAIEAHDAKDDASRASASSSSQQKQR